MKMRWCRLVAGLLLTSIMLISCTSEPTDKVDKPVIKEMQDTEEGQTITVVPTVQAKTGEDTTKYQIQTRLTDFHLFDSTSGIAWGVTRNALRIYYTHDQGETWTNISPSENIPFTGELEYGKEIWFTDANHGWIVRQTWDRTSTIVLRTNDGGATWNLTALPNGGAVTAIYFTNPSSGWIMAAGTANETKEQKILYHTKDSGATWAVAMQNSSNLAEVSHLPELPLNGKVTGMRFKVNGEGMVTLNFEGSPALYVTKDEGKTWSSSSNLDTPAACSADVGSKPQFADATDPSGWLPLKCSTDGKTRYSGFFTADDGLNWDFSFMPLAVSDHPESATVPTFLNRREGWILLDGAVHHTVDGGRSWTGFVPNRILSEMLAKYPEPVKIRFASSRVGWLLIEKAEDRKSLLMRTTDGGRTWRVL
ncbi:YCF48-related protein [Paenibacillus sp. P96]|uniref:YCF48-related protein n=1 Tax=Paenibacillus zeirhizosphaerae TaxID=2987519 RepID=A0ABT9FVD9_9BACL|nr:YCF48-related protein [Paenibacillus sp. P96]MDP4098703.1 YCF48-related protein [Paenibacillus sp. P96]